MQNKMEEHPEFGPRMKKQIQQKKDKNVKRLIEMHPHLSENIARTVLDDMYTGNKRNIKIGKRNFFGRCLKQMQK